MDGDVPLQHDKRLEKHAMGSAAGWGHKGWANPGPAFLMWVLGKTPKGRGTRLQPEKS